MTTRAAISLLLVLATTIRLAHGQAVISNLTGPVEGADSTTSVSVERYASLETESPVSVGMALDFGDLVESTDAADTSIEIECPAESGNRYKLSPPFRVAIGLSSEQGCRIDLMAGTANVQSDSPTEVNAGGVLIGTRGTQFWVRAEQSSESPVVCVFEGAVEVAGRDGVVRQGTALFVAESPSPGALQAQRIPTALYSSVANLYANFDVSYADRTGTLTGETREALYEQHLAVLRNPNDSGARLALAVSQFNTGQPDKATYNLQRSGIRDVSTLKNEYSIDPDAFRDQLSAPNRVYFDRLPNRWTPEAAETYRFLDQNRGLDSSEAVINLRQRVNTGEANSLEYYEIASSRLQDYLASDRDVTVDTESIQRQLQSIEEAVKAAQEKAASDQYLSKKQIDALADWSQLTNELNQRATSRELTNRDYQRLRQNLEQQLQTEGQVAPR